MNQQEEHVLYTRNEWSSVKIFTDIILYLKEKNIKSFADIGSNVGEVTKIMLENFSSIEKIYAYEPETLNFNFMSNRFINEPRVIPIKKAIYYGKKNATLFGAWRCGSHTLLGNPTMFDLGNIPLTTLEEEKLENIDLIKLDVEGSEYNIIKNSQLLKTIKNIIIEFHDFGMDDDLFNNNIKKFNTHKEKLKYQKEYTDNFLKIYLPNHKIIFDVEEQYFLELI